jgi:hypothetical protein
MRIHACIPNDMQQYVLHVCKHNIGMQVSDHFSPFSISWSFFHGMMAGVGCFWCPHGARESRQYLLHERHPSGRTLIRLCIWNFSAMRVCLGVVCVYVAHVYSVWNWDVTPRRRLLSVYEITLLAYMYMYIYMCVCVCVYIYIYIYIYIYEKIGDTVRF